MAAFEKKKGTGQSLDHLHADFIDVSYQKWIQRQMASKVLEYSDTSQITVCCTTWNVNSKPLPDRCDISDLFSLRGHAYAEIYAVSLQEMVDLNVMNVVLNGSTSDDMATFWVNKILDTLNGMTGGNNYHLVSERHVVGLLGAVFAKKTIYPHITDVRSTIVYTGSYGATGNKGGIAMSMTVRDTSMCFIGAHFHASRSNVEQRNLDFQTIYETAIFQPGSDSRRNSKQRTGTSAAAASSSSAQPGASSSSSGATGSSSSSSTGSSASSTASSTQPARHRRSSWTSAPDRDQISLHVVDHDQIYWLGDLNYRIAGTMDELEIMNTVERSDWPTLVELDQLNLERERGNVFAGFEEGKLVFAPTYKFQPNTEVYERRPDKKLRAPAWCDRILWRSDARIHQGTRMLTYQSITMFLFSDHRPVVAWFETQVLSVHSERQRNVYQELLFNVDKWINASTPKLELDQREHMLGNITMEERHRVKMEIRNNGTVMTEWSFVPKNDELIVCQPWLKFSPEDGILAPGETMEIVATILLTVEMMAVVFPNYRGGPLSLSEVVVLRIRKGSDLFCIFSAVIPEENITETRTKAAHLQLSSNHRSMTHDTSGGGSAGGKKAAGRRPPSDDDDDDDEQFDMSDVYGRKSMA